jgi:predicted RNase H-like HicB family nuclease
MCNFINYNQVSLVDNWNILLESTTDGFTVATVLEVPDCQTTDETKEGAVEKVQQLLQKRLAKAEIIKIPVPIQPLKSESPLMRFAGIFQDDPDFMEIIKEMRAEREQESDI